MSKRRDSGSHPVSELEMKDTVSYNASVNFNPSKSKHEDTHYTKGGHQKGPSGKKGGNVQERKRK